MRQPLQPVPVGRRPAPAEGGEDQLGGRMERGELAEHGPGDVERHARLPRDADRPVVGKRERERHVADRPVARDEVVELGLGGGHGPPVALRLESQPRIEEGLADPEVEEPRSARAAGPQQR